MTELNDSINLALKEQKEPHRNNEEHGIHLVSWRLEEYKYILFFLIVLVFVAIFKICFHKFQALSKRFPESCVLIIIGIAAGWVINSVFHANEDAPKFTTNLFFNFLLPPIVLDASYALYDDDFMANLGAILTFSVLGTFFNVFLVGGALYGINQIGLFGELNFELTILHCLVFSTMLSAVDPVAVLAIFEEIAVNKGLYFLVFGESLLNDGVTIVLYNSLVILSQMESIPLDQIGLSFAAFVAVVFGGLAIGFTFGCLTAFTLRFTRHDHHEGVRAMDQLIILSFGYFSYIFAEMCHWSGILSLVACGLIQKRYAFENASRTTTMTVKYSIKTVASVAECIIFIFLGKVTTDQELIFNWIFFGWTIFFCLIVRFATVFGLSAILNEFRVKQISLKEQLILSYSGLRGAVGFSLAFLLGERDRFSLRTNIFLSTMLLVIFFTVFIMGGTIKFLVNKLKIKKKVEGEDFLLCDINDQLTEHLVDGIEAIVEDSKCHQICTNFLQIEQKILRKCLLSKSADDLFALKIDKIDLDDHFMRRYRPAIPARETLGGVNESNDLPPYSRRQKIQRQISENSELSQSLRLRQGFYDSSDARKQLFQKSFSQSYRETKI